MGISASQARLLSITARLNSNEYESQQISNAKMRLATQSEQVSRDYIAALNARQLQFMTYDASGSAVSENLSANVLYQFADMKNQYMLVNSTGQALVANLDAKNFKNAKNLDEFLALYGISKNYKTETLALNAQKMEETNENYKAWEKAIEEAKKATYIRTVENEETSVNSSNAYEIDKYNTQNTYNQKLSAYNDAMLKYNAGMHKIDIKTPLQDLVAAKQDYSDCITFDSWAIAQVAYQRDENGSIILDSENNRQFSELYNNVEEYYKVLNEFLSEAEDLGCTNVEDTYEYSDNAKAKWYTNLWYKMNGESSYKSTDGIKETNYTVLDSKLASSSQWIQDALKQGVVTIEVVTNKNEPNILKTEFVKDGFSNQGILNNLVGNPLDMTLKGITWNKTVYSACTEIFEKDDEAAVARAEAEYTRKNNEIAAKDKKYENKIKTLDMEHNALQTQYESVQSAMNKNIDRSYKTFNG